MYIGRAQGAFGSGSKTKQTVNEYQLKLSVKCETKFGQCLCVVGSVPELGSWKELVHMKWTEGHVWVMREPVKTKVSFF
jgi:hypothetical protein